MIQKNPKLFQPGTFTSPAARALTCGAAAGTAARAPQRARTRPGASRGAAAHAAWRGPRGMEFRENHGKIMTFTRLLCHIHQHANNFRSLLNRKYHRWSTVIPGLKLHHSSGMLLCKSSVLISEPPGKSFEYRVLLCHTMSYYVILCHTAKTISGIKSRMRWCWMRWCWASLRWTSWICGYRLLCIQIC